VRHFQDSVQTYLASGYNNGTAEGEIRTLLAAWRDNDARLRPLLEHSFLLHELAPLSEDLSALGLSGLSALDYLDRSEPSPESWRVQQLAIIERAKTSKADLLLMGIAPVQQLIEASAGQTQKP
jgi:hexosaminidase